MLTSGGQPRFQTGLRNPGSVDFGVEMGGKQMRGMQMGGMQPDVQPLLHTNIAPGSSNGFNDRFAGKNALEASRWTDVGQIGKSFAQPQ